MVLNLSETFLAIFVGTNIFLFHPTVSVRPTQLSIPPPVLCPSLPGRGGGPRFRGQPGSRCFV